MKRFAFPAAASLFAGGASSIAVTATVPAAFASAFAVPNCYDFGNQFRFASSGSNKRLLTGKVLCFTGTLSMPRKEAVAMAEKSGATVVGKFSSNVTNVVTGAGAGSKLSKAQAKGVAVWTEKDFHEKMTVEDHEVRLGENKGRLIKSMTKTSYQFSLAWDAICDLDLRLKTPKGLISYSNMKVAGGHLDVDRIPWSNELKDKKWKKDPVENIVCDRADPGFYRASVVWYGNWGNRVEAPVPYNIRCRVGKDHAAILRKTVKGIHEKNGGDHEGDIVCSFEVKPNGEVFNVKFGDAAKTAKATTRPPPGGDRTSSPSSSSGRRSGRLTGKTICFTGTISMKRADAAAKVQAAGGRVVKDVSSATDYLVCGEGAGSKKTKAERLGIRVVTESEFRQIGLD